MRGVLQQDIWCLFQHPLAEPIEKPTPKAANWLHKNAQLLTESHDMDDHTSKSTVVPSFSRFIRVMNKRDHDNAMQEVRRRG
jgi:hypothetical protein